MKNFLAGVLVTTSLALLGFQVVDEDQKEVTNPYVGPKSWYSYRVQHIANDLNVNDTSKVGQASANTVASILNLKLMNYVFREDDNVRLAHVIPQGKFLTLVWEKQVIESEKTKKGEKGAKK
jgi:hypothetical protein